MSETQGTTVRPNFIVDTPAKFDDFGAHSRIVNALMATVMHSDEIRTIGLIGPWGSGKSTVLHLFEETYNKAIYKDASDVSADDEPPSRVFTFDAWRHHGEPLRRAFLEEFFHFCLKHRHPPQSLHESIEELTGRTTTTETHEEPRISRGGLAILGSFALAAYGLAQGHRVRRVPGVDWLLSGFPEWIPVALPIGIPLTTILVVAASRYGALKGIRRHVNVAAGLAIVALSLVLAATKMGAIALTTSVLVAIIAMAGSAVYVRAGLSRKIGKRSNKDKTDAPEGPTTKKAEPSKASRYDTILGLILNRKHQSKRTRVRGMPSPTSIEFTNTFISTIDATFDVKNPVVIVVDNLDRLPTAEAKDVWAMLRTFFANATSKTTKGPRLAVVIPIAEETVETLYGKDAGQSFMEKTFDLSFSIPRPILTDWQDYLQKRLKDVFSEQFDANHIRQVQRLVDAHYHRPAKDQSRKPQASKRPSSRDELITPRTLNALVNRIATYWIQYADADVPFATVAHYCLNKVDFDTDIVGAITEPSSPVDVYDSGWRQSIAALHYGINRDKALVAVLRPAIEDAIASRERKRFQALVAIAGASEILHRILSSYREAPPIAQKTLRNTAHLMGSAAKLAEDGATEWHLLALAFCENSTPDSLSLRDMKDLKTLSSFAANDTPQLLRAFDQCVRNLNFPTPSDTQLDFWKSMIKRYPSSLAQLPRIFVSGAASAFVEVAEGSSNVSELLSRIECTSADEVVKVLIADVEGGENNIHQRVLARRLLSVLASPMDFDLESYIDTILRRANQIANKRMTAQRHDIERLGLATLAMSHPRPRLTTAKLDEYFGAYAHWFLSEASSYRAYPTMGAVIALATIHDRGFRNVRIQPLSDKALDTIGSAYIRTLLLANPSLTPDKLPVPVIDGHTDSGGERYATVIDRRAREILTRFRNGKERFARAHRISLGSAH